MKHTVRSRAAALALSCAMVLPLLPGNAKADESFLLSFVGDCTLATDQKRYDEPSGFVSVVGDDTAYPFKNVETYFRNDDFTIANLECVLLDEGHSDNQGYAFRGPEKYARILSEHGVEAVTIANNHTADFGKTGYENTQRVLDDAGVVYTSEEKDIVFTTQQGLKIGLMSSNQIAGIWDNSAQVLLDTLPDQIASLKAQGAEVIIYAIHWGTEGYYHPFALQTEFAHKMIDLGVDILYGSHTHVLQPVEEYNGGVIFYSMGNFSFGGNHFPPDLDTAILQQEIIRSDDGSVRLGTLNVIPVCLTSSGTGQNNFQPTPYPETSQEYYRVLSKLDGSCTLVKAPGY